MKRPDWRRWMGMLTAVGAIGLASPAFAGDGVIEINQAAAIAGGVTPGDAPGFPVTLVAGSSYRLTSDLRISDGDLTVVEGVLPTALGFPNSNGSIKLDLNGFSIRCFVGVIGLPGQSCNGNGTGVDFSAITGAVVMNGMVRGMGDDGILLGNDGRVENVEAIDNGDFGDGNKAGIRCGNSCTVKNSVASRNGRYGIFTGAHSIIEGNRVVQNEQDGIRNGSYSVVRQNTVYDNDYSGITDTGNSTYLHNNISQNGSYGINSLIGANFTYGHNTFVFNNGGGSQVEPAFGVQIESNYCQANLACP